MGEESFRPLMRAQVAEVTGLKTQMAMLTAHLGCWPARVAADVAGSLTV
jgi:hypothetical protein